MPLIIPELFIPSPIIAPTGAGEIELQVGRRAFPVAQALFSGSPVGPTQELVSGWYDSRMHPETGSFAVVQQGAALDDLIGEIVRVTYQGRSVFVYVLQAVGLPDPLQFGVYRRPYAAIARLSLETITADVVRVDA